MGDSLAGIIYWIFESIEALWVTPMSDFMISTLVKGLVAITLVVLTLDLIYVTTTFLIEAVVSGIQFVVSGTTRKSSRRKQRLTEPQSPDP